MKTTHTNGEWKVAQGGWTSMNKGALKVETKDSFIAEILIEGKNNKEFAEQQANAKLIAAAPELLKALKFLTNVANKDKPYVYDFTKDELKAHRMAIKAINKTK